MTVVFTDIAAQALVEIGDYISRDSPPRALQFIRELRRQAEHLGDMPTRYPVLTRFRRQGIRRCSFRNYLIFYRIEQDRVAIVHILHGARAYEALLATD